ncbi:tail fiber domain-containing protein [Acetobacter persici]|uniref:tail fiber domain-containing protein n=1 Tax=Acetobacter persici TaxID=1076596 RepID=UPI001BA7E02D|nr:tail fiber domain-containing protein [Acetobacter persici]MBS1017259.1 tail fiber domain-containing protein [Acetobacter persici]
MTYNAPTNLDLSGCNVTATGGATSQTIADLAKSVSDTATGVATATQNATSANTTAQAAQTTANAASTAVSNLGTTYIPQTAYASGNGVPQLDLNAQYVSPPCVSGTAYVNLGGYIRNANGSTSQDTSCNLIIVQYAVNAVSNTQLTEKIWGTGAGNSVVFKSFAGTAFHPDSDGGADLGMNDHAWSNIYSKTAVNVTSDANQKTIVGSLGDTTYTDGQKLSDALYSIDASAYKLNSAITEKGTDNARIHTGFIAQNIQSAITGAGLDPSKYGMWINNPVTKIVDIDTGKKDSSGNPITNRELQPVLDADGKQTYAQMLRYDEIFSILFSACKEKITALETEVAALKTKVGA